MKTVLVVRHADIDLPPAPGPNLGAGKPEGLVVLKTAERNFDVILLCDGLPKGGPTRWSVSRP